MKKSMKVLALFSLFLLLGTTYAVAEPGLDKGPKKDLRVLSGLFTDETGRTIDFEVGNGDRLAISNDALGLNYVLTARLVEGQRVAVTLEEIEGEFEEGYSVLGVQELMLDFSNETAETFAPFQLGFTGLSTNRREAPKDPGALAEKTHIGCCITCGGWRVCCFPAHGYCCSVSSSCGNGCTICVF